MPRRAVHPFLPNYRLGKNLVANQPPFYFPCNRSEITAHSVVGRGGEEREDDRRKDCW